MNTEEGKPKLTKIVNGWAAHGSGWAVHAPTKDKAIKKYHERKSFYAELLKRPPVYKVPPTS